MQIHAISSGPVMAGPSKILLKVDRFPERHCQVGCFTAALIVLGLFYGSFGAQANAQSITFAGNAQHTGQYAEPAQHLNALRWSTAVDLNNTGAMAHYGAP